MANPKPGTLSFEYCECGCKSYTAQAGSLTFAIFDDLKGTCYLSNSHSGLPGNLGMFKSYEEAKAAAVKIALPYVKLEFESLKRVAEQLGVAT